MLNEHAILTELLNTKEGWQNQHNRLILLSVPLLPTRVQSK